MNDVTYIQNIVMAPAINRYTFDMKIRKIVIFLRRIINQNITQNLVNEKGP